MAPALLIPLALLHYAQAARTFIDIANSSVAQPDVEGDEDEEEELCEQAKAYEPWKYTLSYAAAKGLHHNQHFTLRADAKCMGQEMGLVSVIPVIHPENPLELSTARITVMPRNFRARLYVCPAGRGQGHCVASLLPPHRAFRPHQLLKWVPILRTHRRVRTISIGETHEVVDILEWVMLLIILCFLGTTIRALYILWKQLPLIRAAGGRSSTRAADASDASGSREAVGTKMRAIYAWVKKLPLLRGTGAEGGGTTATGGPQEGGGDAGASGEAKSSGAPEDQQPLCPVDISNPLVETKHVWVQSATFVVACVSLLGVLLAVLVNVDGPPAVIGLIVCWPAVFGNFLLYCLWVTACRLQLFSAGLARGICIRGKDPMSPGTVFMAGSFSVLLLCVLGTAIALWEGVGRMAKAKKVLPYVANPLFTVFSVIFSAYTRMSAHHRTQLPTAMDQLVELMNAPEDQEKADVAGPEGRLLAELVRSGEVPIVSEGAFCELCRKGLDPVKAIRQKEPLEEGSDFRFPDLAWHGKMVYSLSGYSVAVLNVPVALFFFLVLTGASVAFAIVFLTTRPLLSSLIMAENSLGQLIPELRPWQTDYELLLDSTVHSFTFIATASEDSTTMMRFALPDGNAFDVYDNWYLATVQLDGTVFPTTAGIAAHGIRRQTTQYTFTVIREYQLVVGVRLFSGKSYDRFIAWSQVGGSIFTVPMSVTTLQLQLCIVSFKIGIPVTEAEAFANEGAGDLHSVFRPMESSGTACKNYCKNEARCLKELVSHKGCFFIYGPLRVDKNFFRMMAGRSAEDQSEGSSDGFAKKWSLGGTMCTRRSATRKECTRMENTGSNILSADIGMYRSSRQAQVSKFQLYKVFGGREVQDSYMLDTSTPQIKLTSGLPSPVAYLSHIKGIASTERVTLSGASNVDFKVTLGRYWPNANTEELLLYLAILLPDKTFQVVDPLRSDVEVVHDPPWFRQCSRNTDFQQFSVCGGWRPTDVVVVKLDPWAPWATLDLKVEPKASGYKSSVVRVSIGTEKNMKPADWAVSKNCSLDLRAMSTHQAEAILMTQAFDTIAQRCMEATIRFRHMAWKASVIEFVKAAIAYDPREDTAFRILAFARANRGLRNYTEFLEHVGLKRCLATPCVQITGSVDTPSAYGDKVLPLHLDKVVSHPNSTGQLVRSVCGFADETALTASLLNLAVQGGKVKVVRSLVDCIKKKLGYISMLSKSSGSTNNLLQSHPLINAISQRRKDLLGILLQVGTLCTTVFDGSPQGSGLLEFAVAHGCGGCVSLLRKFGLQARRLAFSPVTIPRFWPVEAAKMLGRLPVERLTFTSTMSKSSRDDVMRTLQVLATQVAAGRLQTVSYLSLLTNDAGVVSAEYSPAFVALICKVAEGMKALKVLLLGRYYGSKMQVKEILRCLSSVPHLEELDLPAEVIPALWSWSSNRFFTSLRKIYGRLPRLRLLHVSEGSSQMTLDLMRQLLPELNITADREEVSWSAFQRSPCVPKHGMEAEHIVLDPEEKKPGLHTLVLAKDAAQQIFQAAVEPWRAAAAAAAKAGAGLFANAQKAGAQAKVKPVLPSIAEAASDQADISSEAAEES